VLTSASTEKKSVVQIYPIRFELSKNLNANIVTVRASKAQCRTGVSETHVVGCAAY